jgi:hypothetical protein
VPVNKHPAARGPAARSKEFVGMNTAVIQESAERGWEDATWDVPDAPAPIVRFAINGMAYSGVDYLAAQLRRRGLGVPFPYLDEQRMPQMAARLGCWDVYGQMEVPDYLAALAAKRTTANGVFGLTLRPMHVMRSLGHDSEKTLRFWQSFEKQVWVRCRDKILQAATGARRRMAALNERASGRIPGGKYEMVGLVGETLNGILISEGYVLRMAETVGPERLRFVDFEDLGDPAIIESIASWIGGAAAAAAPTAAGAGPDEGFDLTPSVADLDLKRKFLEYVGAFR